MQIVTPYLHEGNSKHRQTRVKTRRWDKAPRWIQQRVSSQALKTYLVLQQLTQGKPMRLAKRLLASRRGVSSKTIYNHLCELIAARVVRAVYAKISATRNAPNLYVLLDIDGGDLLSHMERNCTEKLLQTLKPNTNPRGARVMNQFPAMRKLYEQNGRLRKLLRTVKGSKRDAYRLKAAQARTERARLASVGTVDAWNRAHGGLSWEERNPEEAAWLEREQDKMKAMEV